MGILSTLTDRPFKAIMLNPTRKVTENQLQLIHNLSKGKVEVMPNEEKFTRQDYLEFINRAHISCNLFVTEVHGGVTHCEALMAKNMVIMPRVNNYKHKFEKAGFSDYDLFVNLDAENPHKPDSLDIAMKCKYALESIGTSNEEIIRETCHNVGYEYESYERACDRIVDDLMTLVDQKIIKEKIDIA
jgi:hypothetical protein